MTPAGGVAPPSAPITYAMTTGPFHYVVPAILLPAAELRSSFSDSIAAKVGAGVARTLSGSPQQFSDHQRL
ncbi:MAG: hypothetical protein ACLP01_02400 [Solirubrobacteraceae bacterium]